MELDTFIKNALVSVAKGVKSANAELESGEGKPAFALKRSGWYTDHENGCIHFKLRVDPEEETIQVSKQIDLSLDSVSRLDFRIASAYGVA